ncbi:MAG: HlyD family efflux transporter periplasmic adaptor subunit, partial [Mailhella sp.]|nr:HlyD family efflux transporter periplasmic adaptor subunit [Mailhella sp.]
RIVAPLDGTIVAVPVKQGQTVNANQTTPTIAQIADLTNMEIKIEVSEGDIPFIKPGLRVRYTLLGAPDKPYRTTISTIDPGDKTLSNATSSSASSSAATTTSTNSAVYYYAKARVPNPEGILRLGMTTQNVIEIDKAENVLAIPTITIQNKGRGKKFVRVLEGGIPAEREVETGITNNVMTEIRSGLNEGDKVISTQMTQDELKASINARGGRRPH